MPEILRKLVIPTAGTYALRALADSEIEIRINDDLLIDATGSRLEDVGQTITAFVSLEAGAHAVKISGVSEENINVARITINALAETINGLFKAGVIHRRGPWRSFDAVEYATLEWVDWFNNRRLLEPIGNIPPAEAEATLLQPFAEQARVLRIPPDDL